MAKKCAFKAWKADKKYRRPAVFLLEKVRVSLMNTHLSHESYKPCTGISHSVWKPAHEALFLKVNNDKKALRKHDLLWDCE